MNDICPLRVNGTPIPQGSTQSYFDKKKDRMRTFNPKKVDAWRKIIAKAAKEAEAEYHFYTGQKEAYNVVGTFVFERPKCKLNKDVPMLTTPDLDKLQRALGDGITGILIWDDKLITNWSVQKIYTNSTYPTEGFFGFIQRR